MLLQINSASAQIAFNSTTTNPFNLQDLSSKSNLRGPCSMDFVDIDNDGDLDIFVGSGYYNAGPTYVPRLWFIQNTGSPTNPSFSNAQYPSFGLSPLLAGGNSISPHFTDLDQDGDYDMLLTGWYTYGNIQYFQNTGTASTPNFINPNSNPFGMNITVTNGAFAKVTTTDIDADGDLDLFAGNLYNGGNTLYYQLDTSSSGAAAFGNSQNGPYGFSAPTAFTNAQELVDIDKDGDFDIFSQARYGTGGTYLNALRFNLNQGNPQNPVFNQSQQLNAFNIPQPQGLLSPAFADLDADGDEDLMFIDFYGTFYYYQNKSTYPIFNFDSSSYHTNESSGSISIGILQQQASNINAVQVQVLDNGQGTAVAGQDYNIIGSTSLQFPLGFSYQNINIQILDDALLEGTETIQLQLTNPSAGSSLGNNQNILVYINDNETANHNSILQSQIKTFPNPVIDQLQIQFPEQGSYLIKIFDLDGRNQLSKIVPTQHTTLDINHLLSGSYQLEIYDIEEKIIHQQLIIKH